MQLAKVRRRDGSTGFGALKDGRLHFFPWPAMLGDLLAGPDPAGLANDLLAPAFFCLRMRPCSSA